MDNRCLLLVMSDIAAEREDEINRWYEQECIQRILAVHGVLASSRYRIVEGQPAYLATYDLADISVLDKVAFAQAAGSGPESPSFDPSVASSFRNVQRGVYRHLLSAPLPEATDLSGAHTLMLRGLEMSPAHLDEFEDWYTTDHLPGLGGARGVVRARRFRLEPSTSVPALGTPATFVALWELENREVMATEDWRRRSNTPWTMRIRRLWTGRERNIYERVLSA